MRQHVRYRAPVPLTLVRWLVFPHRSFHTCLSTPVVPQRSFRTGRRPPAEPLEENVISRRLLGAPHRLSGGMLVVRLGVRAGSLPAWTLRLAFHYLPPATNHSQYDVVLAWPGQAWFLGGTDIGGHGKPKAERIKNGIPRAFLLPAHEHSWITAASAPAPTDIWAVTFLGGYVLHWNGSRWLAAPRGNWQTGARFTGITAVSPTDVWGFGTRGPRHVSRTRAVGARDLDDGHGQRQPGRRGPGLRAGSWPANLGRGQGGGAAGNRSRRLPHPLRLGNPARTG